jgi:uncharacterized protein YoxC
MTIIDIALVVLILAASALCIYGIIYMRKLTAQVEAVRKDVHDLVGKTTPVLENLEDVTRRANRIVSEVEDYWNEIDRSIKNIRERISGFSSLKNLRDVEYPAKDLIRNIKAFSKGFMAFWEKFKQR